MAPPQSTTAPPPPDDAPGAPGGATPPPGLTTAPQRLAAELLERADIRINGDRPWDLRLHDPQALDRALAEGNLGLGESYMAGAWDCDRLDMFFDRLLRAHIDREVQPARLAWLSLQARLVNRQNRSRAWEVARAHYDLRSEEHTPALLAALPTGAGPSPKALAAGGGPTWPAPGTATGWTCSSAACCARTSTARCSPPASPGCPCRPAWSTARTAAALGRSDAPTTTSAMTSTRPCSTPGWRTRAATGRTPTTSPAPRKPSST